MEIVFININYNRNECYAKFIYLPVLIQEAICVLNKFIKIPSPFVEQEHENEFIGTDDHLLIIFFCELECTEES